MFNVVLTRGGRNKWTNYSLEEGMEVVKRGSTTLRMQVDYGTYPYLHFLIN